MKLDKWVIYSFHRAHAGDTGWLPWSILNARPSLEKITLIDFCTWKNPYKRLNKAARKQNENRIGPLRDFSLVRVGSLPLSSVCIGSVKAWTFTEWPSPFSSKKCSLFFLVVSSSKNKKNVGKMWHLAAGHRFLSAYKNERHEPPSRQHLNHQQFQQLPTHLNWNNQIFILICDSRNFNILENISRLFDVITKPPILTDV